MQIEPNAMKWLYFIRIFDYYSDVVRWLQKTPYSLLEVILTFIATSKIIQLIVSVLLDWFKKQIHLASQLLLQFAYFNDPNNVAALLTADFMSDKGATEAI